MSTGADYIAMACIMVGMLLFTWLPFDRKHLPAVVLGIVLAGAGMSYLAGYIAIAVVIAVAGITFVAKHLWSQRIRNGRVDI